MLESFAKASIKEPNMNMGSIEGSYGKGVNALRVEVEREVKQKPVLTATSEEMYIAMKLLLRPIMKGFVDLYDLQQKARQRKVDRSEDRTMQDILEEVSTKQEDLEEDLSHEGSEVFEVPEPFTPSSKEADVRETPSLLRVRTEVPMPDDHPNAVLARTLGIRHVSDVQEKLMEMQETHDQKYQEIMELRSQIQKAHRSLAEAEARYAQMEREVTNPNHQLSRHSTAKSDPVVAGSKSEEVRSPRTPRRLRHYHNDEKSIDFVGGDEDKVMTPYPIEQWTSSKRAFLAKKQQRQEAKARKASNRPVAPTLKASTVAVAENSFWSKATT